MEHQLFAGVDVASRKLDVCVVDTKGNPVCRELRVANSPEGFAELQAVLATLGAPVLVGCESTSAYHRPLLRALDGVADTVELNPLVIKRFTQLQLRGSRSDRTDANSIAQYLRTFRPKPSPVTETKRRDLTMAVRLRRRRVEERTANKNALRRYLGELLPGFHNHFRRTTPLWLISLFAAHPCPAELLALTPADLATVRTPGGRSIRSSELEELQGFLHSSSVEPWSPLLRAAVGQLLQDVVRAEQAVRELESLLEEETRTLPECTLLRTIPGVGALTAAVAIAEVGDVRRFPSVDHFIGYCGLYATSKTSGDGKTTGRMVRKGNRMLRLQLLLASTTARD
ncbi:MAG: IS110 family transposase [Myxococcales bacterium]|nr:IS110 family transposase [Myxococcales bacterium]